MAIANLKITGLLFLMERIVFIKSLILAALLVIFAVAILTRVEAKESSVSLELSRTYFNELNAVCSKDGGRLWGLTLCGPTLFVDPKTREVVANQADRSGLLIKKDDLFVGKWPVEMNIANTSVEWGGVKWTMMVWPLPSDQQERAQLMAHESFHRIQDELGLPGANPANSHLGTRDGRVWLQLEWRALGNALVERGPNRRMAVADALAFREYRHSIFPQAANDEKALEVNEGLAEYTGMKMSSVSRTEFLLRAACTLRQGRHRTSFVRSFAYVSGPAYGALLDEAGEGWRREIRAKSDLGTILRITHGVKTSPASRQSVFARAARYDSQTLIATETARDNEQQETLKKYRTKFFGHPVLTLPLTEKVQYSFNPNNLVPLDENRIIYTTMRITDEWGILEVTDGALVIREQGRVAQVLISAPTTFSARPVNGPGWKLQLKDGWEFGTAAGSDNSLLKRK